MDVWDNYIIGGEDTGGVNTFVNGIIGDSPSYIATKPQSDVMIDDPTHLEQIILQENIANEMVVEQNIEVGGNDDNGEIILVPNTIIKQEDIETGEIIVGASIGNEVIIEDDDCGYNNSEPYGTTSIDIADGMEDDSVYDSQLVIDTTPQIKLEVPDDETYHCGECSFILNSRTALKKHIKEAHGKIKSKKKKRDLLTFGNQVYTCLSCSYSTRRRDKLDKHAQKHVLIEGFHPCGKKRQKIGTPPQRHRHNAEEYKCAFCTYSCTVFKAIKKHMKLHESGKNFTVKHSCKICGKDRSTEQDLEKHMKKHRNGERFMCDLCSFMSVQLKKIIQHRRMHTGEKPHLCPFCDYRSARRDNLRSHVRRMHKKENMYIDTFNPNEDLEDDTE